jgi:hypothetical protein
MSRKRPATEQGDETLVERARKSATVIYGALWYLATGQAPRPTPAQHHVLLLGLAGSGKTTLLYLLKMGEVVSTISTVGFNQETLLYHRCCTCRAVVCSCPPDDNFIVTEAGGQDSLRPLWRHHVTPETKRLWWAVDSTSDDAQMEASRRELCSFLGGQTREWRMALERITIIITKPGRALLQNPCLVPLAQTAGDHCPCTRIQWVHLPVPHSVSLATLYRELFHSE